jgi:Tol biopolymer transport system component
MWVLSLGDHQKAVPFLRTEFNEFDGRFSPDGHWVAYVSDESGRREVYVRAFSPGTSGEAGSDTGGKLLISNAGGYAPRWRQDGKELYYIDLNGRLMVVKATTAGTVFQAGSPTFLFQTPGSTQWSPAPDGKRFLFLVPEAHEAVPFTVALNWQAALKK